MKDFVKKLSGNVVFTTICAVAGIISAAGKIVTDQQHQAEFESMKEAIAELQKNK